VSLRSLSGSPVGHPKRELRSTALALENGLSLSLIWVTRGSPVRKAHGASSAVAARPERSQGHVKTMAWCASATLSLKSFPAGWEVASFRAVGGWWPHSDKAVSQDLANQLARRITANGNLAAANLN